MYGSEAWTLSKQLQRKLEATEMWLLRRMLQISSIEQKPNETGENRGEKMSDGLTKWLKIRRVTDALQVARDRDGLKVMIACAT